MIKAGNSIKNFFLGFSYTKKGYRFLLNNKSLFKFILLPLLINILLFAGAIVLYINYFHQFSDYFLSFLGDPYIHLEGWYISIINFVIKMFFYLLKLFIYILSFVFLIIICYFLGALINSPFNELLSEKAEILYTGKKNPEIKPFFEILLKAVREETKKLLFLLSVPLILLLLHLIPVAGSVIYLILSTIYTIWAISFDSVDYSLARKNCTLRERLKFGCSNFSLYLGFGLIQLIPGLNFLLSQLFIIAGTLLYCDHTEEKSEQI